MPPDLTEQARENLTAGATDGPGTALCRGCKGPKEATRLNSARCRSCGKGSERKPPSATPSTALRYRALRTDLPVDVWDRFTAEAAAHDMPPGTYLRELITRRDTKKHGATPSTVSGNKKE